MAWEDKMKEFERRRRRILLMGGEEKIAKRHDRGVSTAREWIERLVDPDSFIEIGMFNHSDMPGLEEKTPADSKIDGYAKVDGRPVAVMACDFTVLSGTTSRVALKKETEFKKAAMQKGLPIVYFGECGGGRLPDMMGSYGLASFSGQGPASNFESFSRERHTPMIMAAMGKCYGAATWHACMADFVIQVKGSVIAVSGPRVLEVALDQVVTEEELGGWEVHSRITGMTDLVAEDEEDCLRLIKRLLGYLPSHRDEFPPVAEIPEGSGEKMKNILKYLPEKRNRGYDMHHILGCIVDKGSLLPIKPKFGESMITALARVGGHVVGLVANNPMFGAGAMDVEGVDKVISFLCLCDSFNIPLIFCHDNPGFLVGKEAEHKKVASKVINLNLALSLTTVPKISIVVRKSYGMAFLGMCGTGCRTDFLVAWPSAEMSFVIPEIAASILQLEKQAQGGEQGEEYEEALEKIIEEASPYGAAGRHLIDDIIDPRETRNYILNALEICRNSRTQGASEHKLAAWPTKF